MRINKFALFALTALICAFAATVSAKPPSEDPPTQPDIYDMVIELDNKLVGLKSDVDTLQGSIYEVDTAIDNIDTAIDEVDTAIYNIDTAIDNIDTAIDDVLAAVAKPDVTTVEIILPTGNFTEILPRDYDSGKVYSGRITGFLQLTAVTGATVDLFCELFPAGSPSYSLAGLEHAGAPEFMSLQVNQQFTCAGLKVRHIHDGSGQGPLAYLTVEWEMLDITDEVINSGL